MQVTVQTAGPEAPVAASPPEEPRGTGGWNARVGRLLRSPYLWALLGYAALAAIVFRNGGFGNSGVLPAGTNALNAWLSAWYFGHQPFAMWLYPFTDWGQPVPGFTGPTLFTTLAGAIAPTVLIRGTEIVSLIGAGCSMMWAGRRIGGSPIASGIAGGYYAVFAETSQLFEGHVPAMISVAIAPAFFVALWQLLDAPRLSWGIGTAVLLYLLISIGDLGMLYFYLFFAIPMAAYAVGRRFWHRRYRLGEWATLGASGALLLFLSFSWLYPFIEGARAQYTTNITAGVLPFAATSGENAAYAFTGYIQDDSYIHFTYHQMFYAAGGTSLLPVFLLLPIGLGVYALYSRNRYRRLMYASGLVAVAFSTGHLYPGVSLVNGWLYDHVPFFDAIPALFRWVEYTILVYAIVLVWFLTDLERRSPWSVADARAVAARLAEPFRRVVGRTSGGPVVARTLPAKSRLRASAGTAGVALVIIGLVLVQNWAVVSEPPGTFVYPSAYTAAYSYLADHGLSGDVLEIPFGGIYDRAPWGGVSASAALLTPAYTGADTAILEAGTAPSLALDEFIGEGLTYGGSRNMTKFLGSANVQYIIATQYSNWNYSSSSEYPPKLSYESLANQTGLGAPASVSTAQTAYAPGNWAGNLSFHPSYLMYFGGDSILYSVLDSPWYPGPAMALVNGSAVGASLEQFVAHASGIVVTPAALAALGSAFAEEAHAYGVPLIEIIPPSAYAGSGVTTRADAWNATGGSDLQFVTANATATVNLSTNVLAAGGYADLSLSGQLATPPGAQVSLHFGSIVERTNLSLSSVQGVAPINVTTPGFFATSADNQTANYTAGVNLTTLNGSTSVRWQLDGNFTSDQYLGLHVRNLTGWSGLSLTLQGSVPTNSLAAVVCVGTTCYAMAAISVPAGGASNETVLRFLLPSGLVGLPHGLAPALGNLTSTSLRWSGPAPARAIQFSNLSYVRVSTPGLVTRALGLVPATAGRFEINLPPTSRLGFLEVSTGTLPIAGTFVRDLDAQSAPTLWQFDNAASGWGILAMAQTYSPLWTVSGPGPALLATVDVGLTGWLIDDPAGAVWTVSFVGDSFEHTAIIGEATGLVAMAVAGVAIVLRTRAVRRAQGRRAPP